MSAFVPNTVQYYLNLVTSEHNQQPNFMAQVAEEVQPFVDLQACLAAMLGIFSPNAQGDQLDKVGQWVGVSREIAFPIAGVYFTWGEAGVGWGQGTWLAPGESENGVTILSDPDYQTLIKLTIAQNQWDGTIPGAYYIFNSIFASQGLTLLIQDNQDMTMLVVILGTLTLVQQAIISGGYFGLRPAGVQITSFSFPSIPGAPVFGWGAENATVSGWGTGAWIQPIS
jgi:hypothetical protein